MRCLVSIVVVSIRHLLAGQRRQMISSAGLQGSALRQNASTKPAALAGVEHCLLSFSMSMIMFCYSKLLRLCQGPQMPQDKLCNCSFLQIVDILVGQSKAYRCLIICTHKRS